ncbi:MAG: hypothetical protein ILM98_13165 [Kiritimatiellae bacterium]|nr:hypothetical protein [Kiritimatiellia bacterium]
MGAAKPSKAAGVSPQDYGTEIKKVGSSKFFVEALAVSAVSIHGATAQKLGNWCAVSLCEPAARMPSH